MTCPKCHTEHDPKRCNSHVVKDPETREPIPPRQCGKTPVKGATVCRSHGAAKGTPAAEKAGVRVQEQAAEVELSKLWVGLKNAPRVEDPVESMARLAGALELLLDRVGEKADQITNVAAGTSMGQIRGELVLLERVAALLARLLDAMARLGIEERKVQFQQDQAAALVAAYRVGLAAIPSSVLSPGDLELMAIAYMRALGWEPEALEAGRAAS